MHLARGPSTVLITLEGVVDVLGAVSQELTCGKQNGNLKNPP